MTRGAAEAKMAKTIGFVGVGVMGRGMARSLMRDGYELKIFNRTRAKAEEVAQTGAVVVDSPAAAAAGADVVVTMLADQFAVRDVHEGPSGILRQAAKDCVVIDCSTVDPGTTGRINEQLRARGAWMLDAPVFGSKNEAENAKLGFIVGGDRAIYDRMQSVLTSMGTPYYVGLNGMGSYCKLVVNLIIAGTLQLWNEAMVLAAKAGVDPEVINQVIMNSRARSGILEMKAPNVLNRDFTPFFALRLMAKDLGLVADAAQALDAPLPVGDQVKEVFKKCLDLGWGDEDFSASIKLLEQQANVEVGAKD